MCDSSRPRGSENDLFAGTPDTFFIEYLFGKAASCKDFGLPVVDISVASMHARTDEEIYVKAPSGIKSSTFWRLEAAVNGTRKASKHWQEFSREKDVVFLNILKISLVQTRQEGPFQVMFAVNSTDKGAKGIEQA